MNLKIFLRVTAWLTAALFLLPVTVVWAQEPGKQYEYKQELRPQQERIKRSDAVGTGKLVKKRIAVSCIGYMDTSLDRKRVVPDPTAKDAPIYRDCIEPFEGFTEEIIDALMETKKFVVIERKDVYNILRELQLAQSNYVRQETALKWEKVLNTQFLITGNVTASKNGGAERLTLRIFDVTTSEVIASIGIKAKDLDRDELVAEAVKRISEKIEPAYWRGKITNVQTVEAGTHHEKGRDILSDRLFYVNGGANVNIEAGDYFYVYAIEQEIVDPDEGAVLGHVKRYTGLLKIVSVEDKFCTAQLQEGYAAKGDWVEYHTDFVGFSKE